MTNQNNFPILGPIIIGTRDIQKAKEFYEKACKLGLQSGCKNALMLDKR